jgi:hypothetical protein
MLISEHAHGRAGSPIGKHAWNRPGPGVSGYASLQVAKAPPSCRLLANITVTDFSFGAVGQVLSSFADLAKTGTRK